MSWFRLQTKLLFGPHGRRTYVINKQKNVRAYANKAKRNNSCLKVKGTALQAIFCFFYLKKEYERFSSDLTPSSI